MGALEFIDAMVGHLVWPITLLTALIIFRGNFRGVIDRIKSAKTPMGEFEFDLGMAKYEAVSAIEQVDGDDGPPLEGDPTESGPEVSLGGPASSESRRRKLGRRFRSYAGTAALVLAGSRLAAGMADRNSRRVLQGYLSIVAELQKFPEFRLPPLAPEGTAVSLGVADLADRQLISPGLAARIASLESMANAVKKDSLSLDEDRAEQYSDRVQQVISELIRARVGAAESRVDLTSMPFDADDYDV